MFSLFGNNKSNCINRLNYDYYLDYFLNKSIYIKSDYKDIIKKHINKQINLLDGKVLTVKEKKALGLNSRLKLTKDLIDCFFFRKYY